MADKTTIGLTPDAQASLAGLMSLGIFDEEKHAALFAMAVAVREGVHPVVYEGASTKWNRGSFDPDVAQLLRSLGPEYRAEPYRALESLINGGLLFLSEKIQIDGRDVVSKVLQASDRQAD